MTNEDAAARAEPHLVGAALRTDQPCPGCADVVQALIETAQLHLGVVRLATSDGATQLPTTLEVTARLLAEAVARVMPHLEAHYANQEHAYSPALSDARHPPSPE